MLILKAKLVLPFKVAYVDVVVVIFWIFGFEIVNMSEWREEGKKEEFWDMGRWGGDKEKWDSLWKAYTLRPTLSCNYCNKYDK